MEKSKFSTNAKIECSVNITLTELEMKALKGLTCYSDEAFLEYFYKNMGTSYLKPYEAGLKSFFKSVRQEIPPILNKAQKARDIFND